MVELIGYARVSKADGSQIMDLQEDALAAAGVKTQLIYRDYVSGKNDDRPGLSACLKSLRGGDCLVVWRLDRLGRNLRHLISTVDELEKRQVSIKVLTGITQIDTTTASGKLMFAIFASLSEFERDLIRERTVAGLQSARARGRIGGRKPSMTPAKIRLAQASMGQPGTVVSDLCKELGVSRQTVYRYVSPTGELTDEALRRLKL